MSSNEWEQEFFIKKGKYFLEYMNLRWAYAEAMVDEIVKVLAEHDVQTGKILDLCCGNGRLSIWLAKKGFEAVGIDLSPLFIEDAVRKANEFGVESQVKFLVGDIQKVDEIVVSEKPFDAVINFWTSIGYADEKSDEEIFNKTRRITRKNGILLIGQCMHREFLPLQFNPRIYTEYEDTVLLEEREFNQISSRLKSTWKYYTKEGENMRFLDSCIFNIRVYGVNEIVSILEKTGWKVMDVFGSLMTRRPFNILTVMNIIAKAV
uniref:Methyltransferase type 11 n=1 Tax=uncultured marine crenarchaeote E37-7F TaxID=907717 RepID=G9BAQ8_9ARCH|nr:methyltransferase type 11 [uncultured marine crenarchaeote E37-7F]